MINFQSDQLTPQRGFGTRLSVNFFGHDYSADPKPGLSFRHPFRPYQTGLNVRFELGLVDMLEPVIGNEKLPMSQAVLTLDPSFANARGNSWIVLECTPNADGILTEDAMPQMLHFKADKAKLIRLGGKDKAREPICLVVWNKGRVAAVVAGKCWNLQYVRRQETADRYRHFFL